MMRIGWIAMPCRVCGVGPGEPCVQRHRTEPRAAVKNEPHRLREMDADAASELIN
jgi:hypothetical protein